MTQRCIISEKMQDHDTKNVEVITYKMLRLAANFEKLWKQSNSITWNRILHAYMMDQLNELAEEIRVAQTPYPWPVIWTKNGPTE